ncbi:MAG: hypothetical protein Q9184_001977 [Pyrenodesmia sp. 2 TL-2023]
MNTARQEANDENNITDRDMERTPQNTVRPVGSSRPLRAEARRRQHQPMAKNSVLRPSKGIILFKMKPLHPPESAWQLQRRALKTPAAGNILLSSTMDLDSEPEIGTEAMQPNVKHDLSYSYPLNRIMDRSGNEVTAPASRKEMPQPKPTVAVREEKSKGRKPLPSEVSSSPGAKEERIHHLMGAALTKGQEPNSLPMANEGRSDEMMANEQLMMDMDMADELNEVEEILEMAEEYQHQQSVSNDNGEKQGQTQAPTHRGRSDSDTSMAGVDDMLPAAAEVGGAQKHQKRTGDGADRELNVGSRRSLVPEYASSPEGTPEKSPIVTRARSRQLPGKEVTTQESESRNVDSGAIASPGPYYGSAGGMMNPNPKLRMRTDEELTDYSNSEYEYEYDDADESSDSDSEVIDLKALGRKKQGSSPSQAGRPASQNQQAPKVSKRQQKILDKASQGVELDSNGTKKGVVRGMGRNLEYLHRGHWIAAVYHYEIRKTLLRVSDERGSYEEEPARGVDDIDRTAFKPEHKFLKLKNRSERPDILFQWNQTFEAPTEMPDFWYDGRRIILDVENHPLRRRPELPLTLSGQCEGLRLEFYKRLNPNISMAELKARMPPQTCRSNGLKTKAVQTAALSNRMTRERIRTGLKAWNARQGSKNIEYCLLQLMPQNIQREVLRTNSTKCFRDLTALELYYVEAANWGVLENLAKAGSRLLDEQTRQEREQKRMKGFEGVQTYAIVEEARRERPPLVPRPQGFRYLMPTNAPSVAQTNNVDNAKHEGSPVAKAPAKRPKHTEIIDLTSDAEENVEMKEHGGYTVSGAQKIGGGSYKQDVSVFKKAPSGVDFRYKRPVSVLDRFIVQEALNLSRVDYQRCSGNPPNIKTDRTESYAYQLSQLQNSFEQEMGIAYSLPQLKSWGRVGSFEDFRALATRQKSSEGSIKVEPGPVAAEDNMLDMEGPTLVEQDEEPVAAAEPKHHDQAQNVANNGRCLGPREASV